MSVDVERRGPITVVTINRPQAGNSLDGATMTGIGYAFEEAAKDPEVRVVVLTAAGEKIFCAGMDLKAFMTPGAMEVQGPGLGIFMRQPYSKPVVAAVNGTAVGGGFELAMFCDIIVAAETAKFGLPEVSRGLIAAGGGTRLPTRVPLAFALELGLTGKPVKASRLYEVGLVSRVVPAAEVLAAALEVAEAIADNGPLAVQVTKALMVGEVPAADWDAIGKAVAPVFASDDAKEGATAFAQKRKPNWVGH
ncbi:enoyl-CoA hydratase/isomerase family protein [Frankia sp. AgB1.9]|uniref:enoyl-CoA hydratase-related protein n=1 Tax=unclassified Frankia TaxID=2632575 RepID=UPI0019319A30|nr:MULTISPECIES: enoyl-CoA hydratase-related protein [unclassified Frankia]MBL7486967.1 enoyl-CoA hydratase/isomerase family protein [Frankia sp. AgW1.1]MBL7552881.1 enoyl-CoA hydratase/isomerase family protein [Frankia sp. AgB1.9]MBL7618108.1 enoyl-CoA hydratase/isomerase family protein [Frankia sp. AgB1.8]